MQAKASSVKEYLAELERGRKDKPPQVREALSTYLDLWRSVIDKGLVKPDDGIDAALAKIEQNGGLYSAAE